MTPANGKTVREVHTTAGKKGRRKKGKESAQRDKVKSLVST